MPNALRWFMCMWPGLSPAWNSGSFRGLCISLLFVFCLQLAWVSTFVWPAILSAWETRLLWWSIAFAILGSLVYQGWRLGQQHGDRFRGCSDLVLGQAQALYLQGSFFEAEELLLPHVSQGEWDVEAALWLASIYRRTGRYEAAIHVLETTESLERSGLWASEIAEEHRKIRETRRNKRLESI